MRSQKSPSLELKCTIERALDVAVSPYRLVSPGPNELIGASFVMEFDGLTVASVREGKTAYDAGLKIGDVITSIDDKPTRYMPLNSAINMIRNSKEKTVKLTVQREILIWRRD